MTDYIIRMDVYVRDYLTRNELLPLAFAALSSRQHWHRRVHVEHADVGAYRNILEILSFSQLEQFGQHLRFNQLITSVQTLAPVHFVRSSQ